MDVSAPLRAVAYDFIARRDGLGGWKQHRDRFRALARMDAPRIGQHSLEALRRLLTHAFETVPYYREAWSAIGFVPSQETTFEDLERLPILTKSDIRDRKTELVSHRFPAAALRLDYTGGTTGTQTSFYRDAACFGARFGRQWGILERCGYRPGDKRALLWGAHADVAPVHTGHRIRRRLRTFACGDEIKCCTVMGADDMRQYHEQLRRFRPAVLYGYPNAIERFARFIRDEHLAGIAVRRVICTAEALHDHQRALFRECFGGDVFNLYCSREHGCVAFECDRHAGLHIDVGSVIVELRQNGRRAMPGERGEIITTDLLNFGMPLIRYRTGDLAVASSSPCQCGCALPTLSSLEGRVADTLHRPDGSTVAGLMLTDLFMNEPAITDAQFVQDDEHSLDVQLVLRAGARADLPAAAIDEVRSIMGPDVVIRVHVVSDIPRNPQSGKYQEVICRIPARPAAEYLSRS